MIETETRDGVRIVTLARPERRNAMVPEMMDQLTDALRAPIHGSVRAIIVTAAGSAFCVGADLKWLGAEPDPGDAVMRLVASHHQAVRAILDAPVPVIAAVNGAAAGGGMSLALAADYRVASQSATFTAAYFRLGLPPDGGNSAFLARTIGVARSMELLLTNRQLSAANSLEWGLVAEVVPPPDLLQRACSIVAGLDCPPSATLLATRRSLDAGCSEPINSVLDGEQVAMGEAAKRPEFAQAVAAFIQASNRRSA